MLISELRYNFTKLNVLHLCFELYFLLYFLKFHYYLVSRWYRPPKNLALVNYMEIFVQHVFHNQLPMLVANKLQQPLGQLVGEYMILLSDRRLPWGHSPVFKLMCLRPCFCFFPITRTHVVGSYHPQC